jgi:hypothetical protein
MNRVALMVVTRRPRAVRFLTVNSFTIQLDFIPPALRTNGNTLRDNPGVVQDEQGNPSTNTCTVNVTDDENSSSIQSSLRGANSRTPKEGYNLQEALEQEG